MYSKGYRRRTRTLFSKDFGKKGLPNTTKILQQYKKGDYVDCKVDPSVVKGMPHKYYHGKTGRVFKVDKRAVGVEFFRQVGGKKIRRLVNARVEHLTLSECNSETKRLRQEHNARVIESRKTGEPIKVIKRQPTGPRCQYLLSTTEKPMIELKVQKVVKFE
ncbi:RL212 [Hepatospora eriocheir]|uniref:RL212 n=1 Tax=Hepatospora eriocheir TaxID=1081669 RepID=A0A1X0QAQ6_9MICR|nr:RL212 [Hepatospora eriocheir]